MDDADWLCGIIKDKDAEIERLLAELRKIAALREDLPIADGQPVDNLAALYALRALEQGAPK